MEHLTGSCRSAYCTAGAVQTQRACLCSHVAVGKLKEALWRGSQEVVEPEAPAADMD